MSQEKRILGCCVVSRLYGHILAAFFLMFLKIMVGMVGNGCVIWLLGFCIKRNNFTIYVLNLAITDFSMLISTLASAGLKIFTILKVSKQNVQTVLWFLWQFIVFTYSVNLYLLTAIGVERCLSILFPIWVRCHRPKHLSTIVSVLFWIVSALFAIIEILLHFFCLLDTWLTFFRILFSVNLFFFTPIMMVSTLILFIKMSFRRQPGKLHSVILIILISFTITAVPFGIFFFLAIIDYNFHIIAIPVYSLLVILNSSLNPIIYFFVGNQCTCRSWESIKVVFQRVFKDEIDHAEDKINNKRSSRINP
uniref:G-protein coupled receptors family 1 profile domain-containing protein n=1 Tax=Anolis carolinensis TaxID=28377 RepID=G1KUP4_ANOCA